jgi:hypothetical protein
MYETDIMLEETEKAEMKEIQLKEQEAKIKEAMQ